MHSSVSVYGGLFESIKVFLCIERDLLNAWKLSQSSGFSYIFRISLVSIGLFYPFIMVTLAYLIHKRKLFPDFVVEIYIFKS